jgi:hypothetical protein
MHTILIAHRDVAFAEHLSSVLRAADYRVIVRSVPWPPSQRCVRCDIGYCPLAQGADLMIYNPRLSAVTAVGQRCNLVGETALAHPDVPMLLAWSPQSVPDLGTLRAIHTQAPRVHVAARDDAALVQQVQAMLPVAPAGRTGPSLGCRAARCRIGAGWDPARRMRPVGRGCETGGCHQCQSRSVPRGG